MEDKEEKLQEQAAPLKNDDGAYVQVGNDGKPVFPDVAGRPAAPQSNDKAAATPERGEG